MCNAVDARPPHFRSGDSLRGFQRRRTLANILINHENPQKVPVVNFGRVRTSDLLKTATRETHERADRDERYFHENKRRCVT